MYLADGISSEFHQKPLFLPNRHSRLKIATFLSFKKNRHCGSKSPLLATLQKSKLRRRLESSLTASKRRKNSAKTSQNRRKSRHYTIFTLQCSTEILKNSNHPNVEDRYTEFLKSISRKNSKTVFIENLHILKFRASFQQVVKSHSKAERLLS